ncbi:MAG: hypothetical protein BWX71_02764 [Deltaproteobacteria bacterium ADurb.Bin072]|nr:MAG: hypothetical protein BWX71_02764 [Deltaproteobacteria bacterium ADurb.Bin072]
MVNGVADHVFQRVADLFYDVLVELRLGTAHSDLYLFAEFEGHVPDHPAKTVEGPFDGHHPDPHDLFLQIPRDPFQGRCRALQGTRQRRIRDFTRTLGHACHGYDHLSDQVHEFVQLVGVDPYGCRLGDLPALRLGQGHLLHRFPGYFALLNQRLTRGLVFLERLEDVIFLDKAFLHQNLANGLLCEGEVDSPLVL